MIIGFDLDDVIVDTSSFFRKYILDREGYDIGESREEYYIKIPGKTDEYADNLVKDIYCNIEQASPVKDAIKSVKKIYDLTKEKVVFITARHTSGWITDGSNLKDKTYDWLNKYIKGSDKFPWEVIFSSGRPKSEVLPDNLKYFVEDMPFFANDVSKKVETVFLIDKGWNRSTMFHSNVIRVKNINTVYLFLEKTLKYQ